jgi:hypothetical protein
MTTKSSSLNKVFADLPVTIFEAMSQAARDNSAINLGQGFPDDPGPEDIRRAAADASLNGYNQYPSMMGIPELRQAIATHYGHWHGLKLDPMSEVMVTSGGTEALTSAILAVVQPGDEVVCFQPVYDSYLPIIRQAGGIPRLVRLEPPHWRLNEDMLKSVFNSKTKAVLFNNPLNPSAVVYPREDLELLARYCQEFDVIAICDEVWEHVTFDEHKHIPLITLPGMRERTIKGRLGRQDILAHRLEDRVRLRRATAAARRSQGASVPDLHHRAEPPGRRRLWPWQARRLFPVDAQGSVAQQGSSHQGTGEPRFSRTEVAGHLLPHRRPVAARAERERHRVLLADREGLQGGCDPGVGLLREGPGDVGGALLLCQEGRDAGHRAGAVVGRGAPAKEVGDDA